MASIVLTFTDPINGIVSTTHFIEDKDMPRVYAAYQHLLVVPLRDDEDEVVFTAKDVLNYIANGLTRDILTSTYNEEIKIECERLQIKYIDIKGKD